MLTKFETKSNRVKGLTFHTKRPWILASLHSGVIQLWDYRMGTLIDRFDEHDGPVRGVHFHKLQPLFVSGGDDYKIKLLNMCWRVMIEESIGLLFHPSLPLIVSGADDRQVKLWRMNDTKAWEVDTLRGHMNNVSCVMFHAKQDIIVSNSEDKSIQIWDATKRTAIQTFRREHDRFWILAAHPEMNLLAAGHDGGMIVFKLERERPAFSISGDYLYYVKDRFLRLYEFSNQKDNQVVPIRRLGSVSLNQGPRTLSFSPTENAVLICSDADGGSYELYIVPKDTVGRADVIQDAKKGGCSSAVFVARNRFAVLDKSCNQALVKNLKNEIVKKCPLPFPTDAFFYAGTGNILCRSEDRMVIFDLQQRLILGELQVPAIKYVVWSTDMESIALLSKHAIVIANKKLVHRCTLHETIRVKSAAWDDNGVLIYTTLNHIKYCLPNGDNGIIRTLDVPVYITKISGNDIYCLNRDGKNRIITIDATEYIFKLSLLRKRFDDVMNMIKGSQLCGQAVIAYLQKKGFPDVALHFVKDERTRFNLALESGNIQVAVASAKEIDEKDHWYRLGIEALRQGITSIVEYAYQRTKNFERLSFLYLVTGNRDKLSKMLRIAELKNDVMGQFHNALYLGDIQERVKILENSGHLPLAYITARSHGLTETTERLAAELGDNVPVVPENKTLSLLVPPAPLLCAADWPLLRVMRGIVEGGLDISGRPAHDEEEASGADWGDEDMDLVDVERIIPNGDIDVEVDDGEVDDENDGAGWDLEDLELPPEVETPVASGSTRGSVFVSPTQGMPVSQIWIQKSSLAGEHAAAGNFDMAMRLLNRQLGIQNFAPLKHIFMELQMGSHTYLPPFPTAPVISIAVAKGWTESASPNVRGPPSLVFKFLQMDEKLKAAYKATTEGKFPEALRLFLNILHTIPVLVVDSRREVDEVKELIEISKEYVVGLKMEVKRKETRDDPIRQQELAAYFTNCKLQKIHTRLVLSSAMTICFKGGNYTTAANFARMLLENGPTEAQAKKARQVLQACGDKEDAHRLNYDYRNPFVVCGATFVPIYRGQKDVSCPYCWARFVPTIQGQLCTVCEIAVVGADASGLLCSPTQMR
ncbi:hypothetical protein HPP92_027024 [Vanilla planifolia]|uniref:Coatomer subunit alpha n=1 Tax=Vanilla planifolia TaxID=51239 RepID=A0A835U688_VANPL|nr:hypothetical protein HPP92_027024 [Vanilla planifolia]